MHILFISDNFPPESNAPSIRTFEHTREWVKKGHKVTVITCAPNFPHGKVYKGYKNKLLSKEIISGINIWRVKTYISSNQGFIRRTLDFVSFMLSSMLFGLFVKRCDLVIGTSPQFFTVISAFMLSRIKRVPFVFELRDIWPESIKSVGIMKKSIFFRLLEKIELFLYKQADLIISVTDSFKKILIKRGIKQEKIKVIMNGVDLSMFRPDQKKDALIESKYDLVNKFVVGYIGTHGLAHALDNILEAASLINNNDIKIMLVGSGAEKEKIEKLKTLKKLNNVILLPQQPKEKIPEILQLCDISLVHLKNSALFSSVIPSKIFESIAMQKPIIISVPEGEATNLIKKNKLGVVVQPENPKDLATAIKMMYKEKNTLEQFKYYCKINALKFNRKNFADEMLEHLIQVTK
tara:strand:+ start:19362 stop:20582 length:1221 start_codon:yes stop_codon:yes gene_type:complete